MSEEREESYMTKKYHKEVIFELMEDIEKYVGGWCEMNYNYKSRVGEVLVRELTKTEVEILRTKEREMVDLVVSN